MLLLFMAEPPPPSPSRAFARVSATIVRGERIDLSRPAEAPGRQQTLIVRQEQNGAGKSELRLVEFQ